ncbi:phosphotransferase [Streptomyces coeruleorubidus]|uniref:phosphotransferase n=1 Tax=Streptomyces coeruleorubidus TaxID=116188 RepID=UPI00237F4B9F|nr:phosphotransferase [Streptomyces coeruleorubidus]WDV54992.1 phosphotransferase [Streptomyces coeruleorubidus]
MNWVFPDGWDCEARLVDGRWVERRPRRPDVERQLRTETRLLPWLAPYVPLAVPVPHILAGDPLIVRHALVPGEPLAEPDAFQGRVLGLFLRALHSADTEEAVRRGVPPAREVLLERAALADDFRARVLPLLPPDRRAPASDLLKAVSRLPAEALVHGDLGPEHLLAQDGALTGVIDFGDAHIGDPAIDLAWALNGTSPAFAEACITAYAAPPALRERSRIWHRLGPWYEVTHGLDIGDQDTVRSGLDGVRDRLSDIRGP